jgi:DNA-binding MarR family transcriptional regulator
MVAQTSKDAYGSIQYHITERQQQVLEAIEDLGTASNLDIAEHLRMTINRITGRVTELSKKEIIECIGTEMGRFGKQVQIWKIKEKKTS